jgi:hypothetical protein
MGMRYSRTLDLAIYLNLWDFLETGFRPASKRRRLMPKRSARGDRSQANPASAQTNGCRTLLRFRSVLKRRQIGRHLPTATEVIRFFLPLRTNVIEP